MKHEVDVGLLCEDRQHAAFARCFLERRGWNRKRLRASDHLTLVEMQASRGAAGEQP